MKRDLKKRPDMERVIWKKRNGKLERPVIGHEINGGLYMLMFFELEGFGWRNFMRSVMSCVVSTSLIAYRTCNGELAFMHTRTHAHTHTHTFARTCVCLVSRGFKRLHFVLRGTQLSYSRSAERHAGAAIQLDGCSIGTSTSTSTSGASSGEHILFISHPERGVRKLTCPNAQSLHAWLSALRSASAATNTHCPSSRDTPAEASGDVVRTCLAETLDHLRFSGTFEQHLTSESDEDLGCLRVARKPGSGLDQELMCVGQTSTVSGEWRNGIKNGPLLMQAVAERDELLLQVQGKRDRENERAREREKRTGRERERVRERERAGERERYRESERERERKKKRKRKREGNSSG